MLRKRYSTEQIVTKLRQAEVELGRVLRTPQVCTKLGISEQTYDRWRKEYGGLGLDQAKRLTALEQEHLRLKKLVADQALDKRDPQRGGLGKRLSPPWETPGRAPCLHAAGRFGAAGLPSPGTRPVDPPASGARAG